jgi:predicted AlkP superfamily phosphohydrolase/phosphomutase
MLAGAGTSLLPSCNQATTSGGSGGASGGGRVFVLAFDGMDPRLVRRLMQAGRLPNFSRLAAMGSFEQLISSTPPQTPVAFSNIISGADPGTHQIFDFIHRDPAPRRGKQAVRLYSSTSDVQPGSKARALHLGGRRLALSGGESILMRKGPSFWGRSTQHGIDTDVYYLPSNYPPQDTVGPGRLRCISGMGTPDLLGTYGNFAFYTPDAPARGKKVIGGRFIRLEMVEHRGQAALIGPPNHTIVPDARGQVPRMTVPFKVVRDPQSEVARIEIDNQLVLLNKGEWSNWLPIEFPTQLPGAAALDAIGAPVSVPGMVRFYLKQVHPKLELYASPINLDPAQPAMPISSPPEFAQRLAKEHGRFHTLGIPEDTKALDAGVLNEDEFLQQAYSAHDERTQQYHQALENMRQGLLFFYFGTTDLVSHMFWRDRDPGHPGRVAAQGDRYANVIDDLYIHMDELVAAALEQLRDEDTLIVLSDHGFTSFRRSVNLNTWLLHEGYLALNKSAKPNIEPGFQDVDWTRTRAYALGLNSLFINVHGRERHGTVAPGSEQTSINDEIAAKLAQLRDVDDVPVIDTLTNVAQLYPTADPRIAPDLIVGYADNYRVGWDSVLGGIPEQVLEDNLNRWSGDHCISAGRVPGILLTNRKITVEQPTLCDIAATILGAWQLALDEAMTGRDLFA